MTPFHEVGTDQFILNLEVVYSSTMACYEIFELKFSKSYSIEIFEKF